MIKENKKMLLITLGIILLPIIMGLLLWNQLPDTVVTHWGANNQPDGYSSKGFAVIGLPAILSAAHLICIISVSIDPKAKNINGKMRSIVMWICPLTSIAVCTTVYGYNLGYQLDMGFFSSLLIGVLYIILGDFIPKIKQNYTIGFRVSWALNDADNWFNTHRFGGKCMVIGGIILIITSPLKNMWIIIAAAIIPCILPAVYSYMYYRKKL